MYGYWYSVKQHYSFSKQEFKELFWTSLAFTFVIAAYFEDLFVFSAAGDVRLVISDKFAVFFLVGLGVIFLSMYAHVALQKLVGIRLGYKVTYSYWLNGILIGLFLAVLTFGKIPILSMFILPGAVKMEHTPSLRLGKFRYSINAKDIARVGLAGPIAHIVIVTFLGALFFASGKSTFIMHLITANLFLLIYSMLPIPKIDMPTKMDTASDGLGIFFFRRDIYVLCLVVVIFYSVLIWVGSMFSFISALILALVTILVYSIAVKPPS